VQFGNSWKPNSICFANYRIGDANHPLYTNGNSADNAGPEVQFGNSRKLNSIYFTNYRIGDSHHAIRRRWHGVATGAALGPMLAVRSGRSQRG
jgi:hypothetical protein